MVIEGFKTYKDQTISEPLNQHINVVGEQLHCDLCILMSLPPGFPQTHQPVSAGVSHHATLSSFMHRAVGANGSGKTNFFDGKRAVGKVSARTCNLGLPLVAIPQPVRPPC